MKIPTLPRHWPALPFTLFLFSFIFSTPSNATCIYSQAFQGEELDIGIMLSWSTSSEVNNSIFVIERSEDGAEFTSIGTVSGAGNSNEIKSYHFFDIDIKGKYIMYRLKQMDFDGSSVFSKSVFINKEIENNFIVTHLSDEVTAGAFEVSIDASTDNHLRYLLLDWKGHLILQQNIFLEQGLNDLAIDLHNAKEGIYKLVLIMDEEEEELTFRKVDDPKKQNTKQSTVNKD